MRNSKLKINFPTFFQKVFYSLFFMMLISCSADALIDEVLVAEDDMETTDPDSDPDTDSDAGADDDMGADGEMDADGGGTDGESGEQGCTNVADFVFVEKDGLVNVEFENAEFTGDWKLKTNGSSFSGDGYMVWEGAQHLGEPGNATTTFKIQIKTPGTYQFLWKSAVTIGDNGTDHNDTWLRFNDADDFFAQKNESVVYPKDSGKTPNPEGASKDGWFKIYRSGSDLDFKWQSSTFDNNAHDIFVVFEEAKTYTMEISVRSSGHGIDKFVLFNGISKENAISDTNTLSEITCN